ncbi:hypothetical protein PILCRDRAFT_821572 [Piloderma croceum F 1598]|uniref:Uncharacterized protein n=1 Tax=Piloderma croceum (strain F 1598) TaxID=765440 RepID=A0A0C3B4L9_PILCF|nr:hypothetical protein PILCRDRAFT_821572 [Piloderma croceum F 1598]
MRFIQLAIVIAMFHTSSTLAYKRCTCTSSGDPGDNASLEEANNDCCTKETYWGTYVSYDSHNELCLSPKNLILNDFPGCCTSYSFGNSCS